MTRLVAVLLGMAGCSDFELHQKNDRQAPAAPDVTADPPVIDVGARAIGEVIEVALTVANRGGATLDVSGIAGDADAIEVVGETVLDLEPGAATVVTVRVTVDGTSAAQAVHVTSDDPDSPDLAVPVLRSLLYPDLVIEPDAVDLGMVPTGTTAYGEARLRNVGDAPLHVKGVVAGGLGWSLVDPGVDTIAPGEHAVAQVALSPTAPGDWLGTLRVDSDDPDGVEEAELVGYSEGPYLTVTPATWDFGVLGVGAADLHAFQMANVGELPVTVTAIELTGAGFELPPGPALPVTIQPGQTEPFAVRFVPATVGPASGEVVVTSDDVEGPDTVTVTGEGWDAAPDIDVTPPFWDFGPVGNLGVALFDVANLGDEVLNVDAITSDAPEYVVHAGLLPYVIPPGQSATFEVWFEPSGPGLFPSEVHVSSDDPDEPVVDVPLVGEGIPWSGTEHPEEFVVSLQVADVAFVVDTTGSMGGLLNALSNEFRTISDGIAAVISDVTFGVAHYEDYNLAPFGGGIDLPYELLQQQTDDLVVAQDALDALALGGGGDTPESSMEALFQAATGRGYDMDCDGVLDPNADVPPFLADVADPFGGTVLGAGIVGYPGDLGGMGFREGVTPVFVLATDAAFRDPDDGDPTPGGCADAGEAAVVAAIDELGGRVIVVGVSMANPNAEMESLATATGAIGDLDGDGTTEPLAIGWNGASPAFRDGVIGAIEALAANGGTYGEVHLEEVSDPLDLVTAIEPVAYFNVASGSSLRFELAVSGTVVEVPDVSTEPVALRLVGDGTVLELRTIHVLP